MSDSRYITNAEYRKQKAALTRAINSGDPRKVILACHKVVNVDWRGKAWPDDWHRWNIALGDAKFALLRAGEDELAASIPYNLEDL